MAPLANSQVGGESGLLSQLHKGQALPVVLSQGSNEIHDKEAFWRKLFGRHSKMFGAVSVLSGWLYEMNRSMDKSMPMFSLEMVQSQENLTWTLKVVCSSVSGNANAKEIP